MPKTIVDHEAKIIRFEPFVSPSFGFRLFSILFGLMMVTMYLWFPEFGPTDSAFDEMSRAILSPASIKSWGLFVGGPLVMIPLFFTLAEKVDPWFIRRMQRYAKANGYTCEEVSDSDFQRYI